VGRIVSNPSSNTFPDQTISVTYTNSVNKLRGLQIYSYPWIWGEKRVSTCIGAIDYIQCIRSRMQRIFSRNICWARRASTSLTHCRRKINAFCRTYTSIPSVIHIQLRFRLAVVVSLPADAEPVHHHLIDWASRLQHSAHWGHRVSPLPGHDEKREQPLHGTRGVPHACGPGRAQS